MESADGLDAFISRPQQEGQGGGGEASYLQYIYIKYGRAGMGKEEKSKREEEEEEEEGEVNESEGERESDGYIEDDSDGDNAAGGQASRQKRSQGPQNEDSDAIRLMWQRELKKNIENASEMSAGSPAARSPKPAATPVKADLDGDQLEEIDISNSKYSEMNTLELKIDNFCEGGESDWAMDDIYVPSMYERSSPKPADADPSQVDSDMRGEGVALEEALAGCDLGTEVERKFEEVYLGAGSESELDVASRPSPQRITDPLLSHMHNISDSGVLSDSHGFSAALARQLESLDFEQDGHAHGNSASVEGEYLEIDIDEDLTGWPEDQEAVELFAPESDRRSSAIQDLVKSVVVGGSANEADGSGGYSERIKAMIYGRGAGITGPEDCEVYEFDPNDICRAE